MKLQWKILPTRNYIKNVIMKDINKLYDQYTLLHKKQRDTIQFTYRVYLDPRINLYTKQVKDWKINNALYKIACLRGVNKKTLIMEMLHTQNFLRTIYQIDQEYGVSVYGRNFYTTKRNYIKVKEI
jgi:hypothetical protein